MCQALLEIMEPEVNAIVESKIQKRIQEKIQQSIVERCNLAREQVTSLFR